MESRTDELSARLLRCPVGCAFLLTIERDQVPVALAVTPPQAFARAAMALRALNPWSRDFAQAVPAALSRGSRLASLARGSGGSSGKPLAHSGVSLPEGDSGHRSALRSPLPWRERVRVRGTPEVTPGVPVRSPRAQASDAAAHRRSRISGPCTRATPATVFADHRMPSLAAPPRGAPHPHPNGVGPVTRMLLRDWSRTRRPVSTALPRGLRTSRERPCPGWYVRVVRSTAGVSCPRALFH